MKELLLYWMRKQKISDDMLWKQSALNQECFIRDTVTGNLLGVPVFVISSHTSKSIRLPVYGFTMHNGVKIYARENFYGWKLSIELPADRPYADIIPKDLICEGYKETINPGYFEGFDDDWCYDGYDPENKEQRKFSIGIYSNYRFYVAIYMLSHLYENIDFTEDGDKLTETEIIEAIEKIYKKHGYNDMFKDTSFGKEVDRRLMYGFEILWGTYSLINDYKFRKEKGLEYSDVNDMEKDPERFAKLILRFPEARKRFAEELYLFNVKY